MSDRVAAKVVSTALLVGVLAGGTALSGCTALGSRAFSSDRTVTGSTASGGAQGNWNQPMPEQVSSTNVAMSFIPPADIGGGTGVVTGNSMVMNGQPSDVVTTAALPDLTSSSSQGNVIDMPAQPALVPVVTTAAVETTVAPNVVSMPTDAYVHEIQSGESLYTVARQYDVTAQAIIQANGLGSPDKIYVGQRIVIPGKKAVGRPVVEDEATAAPVVLEASLNTGSGAPIEETALVVPETPAKPLAQPAEEPVHSGAEKFRWPASGRVITDFASSKGTGINIELPEGAAIRAAENGQVIYAGNGVEGYGNLVLIRHPNGYVSAYAHLKDMSVKKGDVVSRGDNIGSAGMTGGVSRPQLHFELRKGATPVDPMPLLAA